MGEATCAHCERWDPLTLAPIGPECGRAVVSIIRWIDGRYSPACDQHGLNSLTPETRSLVAAVDPLPSPVATSPASPSAEWIAAVKSLTLEGTIYSMRLVGAPEATSPASPLPPTSPDGAGASCSPLARAAGFPPGWSPGRWAKGLYYRPEGIEPDERAPACGDRAVDCDA